MTVARREIDVPWIDTAAPRPRCDVPWLGYSIVQADGSVNFCCFSSSSAGNVNGSTFEEVWNGPIMRQIRSELRDGRLPSECQTTSCPIFRGDELHNIVDRVTARRRWESAEASAMRVDMQWQLSRSAIQVTQDLSQVDRPLSVTLVIPPVAQSFSVDLFVSVQSADGTLRFLPTNEAFPLPFQAAVPMTVASAGGQFTLWQGSLAGVEPGAYRLCAALFEENSDPNVLDNCLAAVHAAMSIDTSGAISVT